MEHEKWIFVGNTPDPGKTIATIRKKGFDRIVVRDRAATVFGKELPTHKSLYILESDWERYQEACLNP